MSIKIIKKILILALFYFTFTALNAEESLKSVGKFKNWESFILSQDGNKTCFTQSIPLLRAPKKFVRDPSRLFISFRPKENIKNEISVTSGYEFKAKGTVTAKSGKKTYDLFSKGKFAWVVDDKDEVKYPSHRDKTGKSIIYGVQYYFKPYPSTEGITINCFHFTPETKIQRTLKVNVSSEEYSYFLINEAK